MSKKVLVVGNGWNQQVPENKVCETADGITVYVDYPAVRDFSAMDVYANTKD